MNLSAKELGLVCCPYCQKMNYLEGETQRCTRCHAKFRSRKAKSLQWTLAWTIAAMIMFIPANVYPMMRFYTLGVQESSTILEGIMSFIKYGMYPIALIIFAASFIIPLGKIVGLGILMHHVRSPWAKNKVRKTKMYHFVEYLGPWSMLDVFVVTVMAAVVNLGFITTIEAASGITYFALTVIFTMFAAASFDPRLLWDKD